MKKNGFYLISDVPCTVLSEIFSLIMKCFHFHVMVRFGRKFECMKEMQILGGDGKVRKRTLLLGV